MTYRFIFVLLAFCVTACSPVQPRQRLSFKDLRDANVVKQAEDFSCGAAALATLATYGLDHPVSEREVLDAAFAGLDAKQKYQREHYGLSLLDLQRVAEKLGFSAAGFKLKPENLSLLRRPVIVFIKTNDEDHFSVLRGVSGNRVLLADPSLGNVRMTMYKFLDMWLDPASGQGIVFPLEPAGHVWPPSSPLDVHGPTMRPEAVAAHQMIFN